MTSSPACREISAAIAESREGTAPVPSQRWLLIEFRGPWGSHIVDDIVPPEATQALRAHGIGILVVRPPDDRAVQNQSRMWLTDLSGTIWTWQVTTTAEQTAHVADIAIRGVAPAGSVATTEPMLLVCTNGKRDACCALVGRAIANGVNQRHAHRVWECSHLGGHRFAAVTLLLPANYVYQCSHAADADDVLDEAIRGRLRQAGLRGRAGRSAAVQCAELAARRVWNQWAVDAALTFTDVGDEVTVTDADQQRLTYDIESGTGPLRPESCGGAGKPLHWVRAVARTSH